MRRLLVAMLSMLMLVGCGISAESVPRPLPTEALVPTATPSPAPSQSPAERFITLWFARGNQLVPARRTAPEPVDSQGFIDLLAAGPTEAEAADGMRSAIVSVVSGEPLVETAESAGLRVPDTSADTVAVVLKPEFTELLGEEQLLVLGEVVTTLAVGAVQRVLFVDEDGQRLGVPLPDGRLRTGPVSPADYASLLG